MSRSVWMVLVEDLRLDRKIKMALNNAGFWYMFQVARLTRTQLREVPGIGPAFFNAVRDELLRQGTPIGSSLSTEVVEEIRTFAGDFIERRLICDISRAGALTQLACFMPEAESAMRSFIQQLLDRARDAEARLFLPLAYTDGVPEEVMARLSQGPSAESLSPRLWESAGTIPFTLRDLHVVQVLDVDGPERLVADIASRTPEELRDAGISDPAIFRLERTLGSMGLALGIRIPSSDRPSNN